MKRCIFWIPFVWFLALLGIINIIISYACKWSLQGHFGDNFVFPQSYDAAAKPLKTFVLNLISKSIFDNKNAAIVQKSINYRVSYSEKVTGRNIEGVLELWWLVASGVVGIWVSSTSFQKK